MQQETTEALNDMSNAVLHNCETIEHLNATKYRLSGKANILEELIHAFQSNMETRVVNNTNGKTTTLTTIMAIATAMETAK